MAKSFNSKLVKVLGFGSGDCDLFLSEQKQSLKILNRLRAQIKCPKAVLLTLIMKLWLQDG